MISFPVEAAAWLGQSVDWTRKHEDELPVIHESNKVKLFHPRTFLDIRLKKFRNQ